MRGERMQHLYHIWVLRQAVPQLSLNDFRQVVDFGEPNNTLYIKNLNEKYSKSKVLDELKSVLRKKFTPYGEILDIVALSNFYAKGQVFAPRSPTLRTGMARAQKNSCSSRG